MNTFTAEQHILTIAMLAAFADGQKSDAEREAVRRVAEGRLRLSGDTVLLDDKAIPPSGIPDTA